MRRVFCLLIAMVLGLLPAIALVESAAENTAQSIPEGIILTGKVRAADTLTVSAPFGGIVEAFTLFEGQRVAEGEVLLELATTKVYAPADGVVRGIFAVPGDSASYVQGRYGALCFIEPSERYMIETDTSQGFESEENRFLHIGEPVYLQGMSREGTGRISQVSGERYTVEILGGSLVIGDSATLYRGTEMRVENRIGRGSVQRVSPVAIQADGSVLRVHVQEGGPVQRGALLFEMVSGALDGMEPADASIRAPVSGIIAGVSVQAGQNVTKNQPLLTLHQLGTFRLVTSINEMDAQHLKMGHLVSIGFDSIPDKRFEGAITFISGVGSPSDNYTEYTVHVDFTPDDQVKIGMSGTGYGVPMGVDGP